MAEYQFYHRSKLPLFWTWIDGATTSNIDRLFKLYAEHNIRGIQFKGTLDELRKVIPIAKKHQIDLYVWWWVLNQPTLAAKHPDWLDVNAEGFSLAQKKAYVDHYQFLNPSIDAVREELIRQANLFCQLDGIKGISLDFARYVDAILPVNIQPKYGIVQDKVYPAWDYGYHPAAIERFKTMYGYDPRKQTNPSDDARWLSFRLKEVNRCVRSIADHIRNHQLQVCASPFPTQKIAQTLVRQDWTQWQLDFYLPMAYYKFYNETIDWVYQTTKENVALVNPIPVITAVFMNDLLQDQLDPAEVIRSLFQSGSSGMAFFGTPDTAFLKAASTFDPALLKSTP
ncbi:MAG: hypothetical protein ACP5F6_05225 [Microbacter sp.]